MVSSSPAWPPQATLAASMSSMMRSCVPSTTARASSPRSAFSEIERTGLLELDAREAHAGAGSKLAEAPDVDADDVRDLGIAAGATPVHAEDDRVARRRDLHRPEA